MLGQKMCILKIKEGSSTKLILSHLSLKFSKVSFPGNIHGLFKISLVKCPWDLGGSHSQFQGSPDDLSITIVIPID